MRTSLFLVAVLIASVVGCVKQEDDPSHLVVEYFKAINNSDSSALLPLYTKDLQKELSTTQDSLHSMKHHIDIWKGTHAEATIKEVKIEKDFPNIARIYFSATMTGKQTFTVDSGIYFLAAKEDGKWKLSAEFPRRDEPKR